MNRTGSPSCESQDHKDQHDKQDAEIRESLGRIKNKILVMSGKGGVGKSSVAAYLSVCLAKKGYNVGLMDVDLHGPSIPRILGLKGNIQPSSHAGKAMPISYLPKMQVISIELLMGENKDTATIWRGPLKIGVIRQFISDIEWPDLDYLIIDSPPGTGDEPLTVAQTIPDAQAVIVTTPQEISLADVRKSINFCRQVRMNILGIVENMSGLQCPHCGKNIELFQAGGGQLMAKKENINLLASFPIELEVVKQGDRGSITFLDDEQLAFTKELNKLVDKVVAQSITEPAQPTPVIDVGQGREDIEDETERVTFAIPLAGGKLCSHFGHCEQFVLIETAKGAIKGKALHTPPAHEPGVLPEWLHEQGAHVIIAGGMGARAQDLFQQKNIRVVTGAPMDTPESLVEKYLSNTLVTGENVCDH